MNHTPLELMPKHTDHTPFFGHINYTSCFYDCVILEKADAEAITGVFKHPPKFKTSEKAFIKAGRLFLQHMPLQKRDPPTCKSPDRAKRRSTGG